MRTTRERFFVLCVALLLGGTFAGLQLLEPAYAQSLEVPVGTIVPTETVDGLAVERTRGSGGVTNDGAAQYTIPLWIPAGRGGIQPDLSLVYNSRSGNGGVGVGWGLSGFPRKWVSRTIRCAWIRLLSGCQSN